MIFLLKRAVAGSLIGLIGLTLLGVLIRQLAFWPVCPLQWSTNSLLAAGMILGGVAVSDSVLHGLLLLVGGEHYRRQFRELAEVFRGQSILAILAGSLMAGVGEELVFRGSTTSLPWLLALAVLFGLAHHIRASLQTFTLWSIWEGTLLALGFYWTGDLAAVMLAHCLHDGIGFGIFRWTRLHSE